MKENKQIWQKARKKPIVVEFREVDGEERIETREGILTARQEEDFIIRGVDGEVYPIKKSIFYRTYEIIEEDMDECKLKPSDLKEKKMKETFEQWYFSREFVPHGVMISNLCYLGFKQGAEYMRQQIKSACEFYLKYKDEPELLFEEKREYRVILAHLFGDDKDTSRYNEWLFKLAFKSVLDEELKVYNE